jgi:hypothetical protein
VTSTCSRCEPLAIASPFHLLSPSLRASRSKTHRVCLAVTQRTLPAPVVNTVLHGCHTRLEGDATLRRWWYVDAEGQIAGKLAAKIVKVIMGKHKPIYDRSQNLGDFVVVVNADKVAFTGRKREQKVYRYHTGWPGGLVTTPV